jgi:hydroxyacylglutathione hydrolase
MVYDSGNISTPLMVFTGDILFADDVGRTDLLGKDLEREQSSKLYNGLQKKVLTLGDYVIVYPGHGDGSVCGHHISDREVTTIGYEKKSNPLLNMDKEKFIETMMKQKHLKPSHTSQKWSNSTLLVRLSSKKLSTPNR